jgi:hypothetical protein
MTQRSSGRSEDETGRPWTLSILLRICQQDAIVLAVNAVMQLTTDYRL